VVRLKYKDWKKNTPSNLLQYFLSPCPWGLRIVNFIFQKIFRINSEVPFMVHFTSKVSSPISIGKGVATYFANSGHCYIQSINGISIGDYTMFAPGVKIISANHLKGNLVNHDKSLGPVIIGDYCWIGANVIILPGVKLGNNVLVAAGSVVTKSFESNLVIGGNPAKVIKENPQER
jgi:acetyltransferase-like isoleucine patch superfamily enzyme